MKHKLSEICTIKYGKDHKHLSDGIIPVYGSGGIMRYADTAIYNKKSVLIPRKGTLNNVFFVREPFWTVDTLFYTEINEDKVIPEYLYYFMKTLNLADMNVGTAVPSLTTSLLYDLKIVLPSLCEQQSVVNILTALDHKIAINTKINHHLEQMAQAIFKSWFVDFEPWGGVMPSDWRQYKLGDFFPVKTGKMNANVSSDIGEYPFFSCSRDIAWTDQYSFDGKAILVAGNGEFNVKWYDGKFEAYQRTYVLMPSDSSLFAFLYYVTKDGLAKITSNARGSVIRFITKGNIENYSFFAPSHLQKLVVIDMFASINKQIENNIREISILSSVRDTLLPRLLSGELSVSDLPDVK